MTPLGNKLGEKITLRGENYSSDLAGDIFAVSEVSINFAGDKKISSRTLFPWLSAEDNPVISW